MSTNLTTVIAGHKLPLLATEVMKKDEHGNKVGTGKFWHCFRLPTSKAVMFGLKYPALDVALPTSIEIDGHEVALTVEMQSATYEDRVTKTVKVRNERHLSAKGNGTFTSPTLGEDRSYSVTITDLGDGTWNIKISVNRGSGSVSPESRQAKATANAEALAAFLAA